MSSPIKIARVIARLNVGGPAIQAILMTEAFQKRDYSALLIAGDVPEGEASIEYLAEARGVHPVKISSMSRKVSYVKDFLSLWKLIQLFRREKPSIVHTHTAKAGALGRIAAIVAGVPVRVHTFHGHVFEGYFSPLKTGFFKAIERFLARQTHCIIAISESQRRDLVEKHGVAPAGKVVTVPLGFELDPFLAVEGHRGSIRRMAGCPPGAPLIGWIGRLTSIKDPALFVATASAVHEKHPQARFVLVGDGELRPAVEKQVEQSSLNSIVSLLGLCREVSDVYADVDLVVLTSANEGTPVVLLEAMACGRPFVATNVGGVADLMVGPGRRLPGFVVFENGILAERHDAGLGAAVSYLLENPDQAREMGCVGRKFVAERYSQQRLADDLERIYLELLERNGRSVHASHG